MDSSHVYSNLPIGNYHRHIYQGNYNITFSKSGYYPKTINSTILNNDIVFENMQLVPIGFVGIEEVQKLISKKTITDLLGRKNKNSNLKIKQGFEGKTEKVITLDK